LHRRSFEMLNIDGKPAAGIVNDTLNLPRNTTIEAHGLR